MSGSTPGLYLLDASSSLRAVTNKNTHRHCQTCPGGQNCPWWRITVVGLIRLYSELSQHENLYVRKSTHTQRYRQCRDFMRARNHLSDLYKQGNCRRGYSSSPRLGLSRTGVLNKENLRKWHERKGKYFFFNCFCLFCGLHSQWYWASL